MSGAGLELKSTILSNQDLRTVASPTFANLTIIGTVNSGLHIITDDSAVSSLLIRNETDSGGGSLPVIALEKKQTGAEGIVAIRQANTATQLHFSEANFEFFNGTYANLAAGTYNAGAIILTLQSNGDFVGIGDMSGFTKMIVDNITIDGETISTPANLNIFPAVASDVFIGGPTNHIAISGVGIQTFEGVAGLVIDKSSGLGIKIDNAAPTFGWRDLRAEIRTRGVGGTDPNDSTYIGNVKAYSFAVNDEAWIEFHIPHDYVSGTDIHLHFHWSHNSAIVTGGNITIGADVTYAKGHNQATFSAEVNLTLVATAIASASSGRYRHMIPEIQLSAAEPSASQIDTDDLEPDGLVLARIYLVANNITSSGAVPDPFIHEVDLHYQSTNIATKDKAPDFYT